MTVVLCGVGGDSGTVDPVPTVDGAGEFEYVPVPEKCETAETATYGTLSRRRGDGVLADGLDRVLTPDGWTDDPARVRSQAVHRDPNLVRLSYGEHRRRPSPYVQTLATLSPGDVVGFYTGLRPADGGVLHRHLFGYLVVDRVALVDPDHPESERRAHLAAHPHNAHAKRYRARGALYYQDPVTDVPTKPVVLVAGAAGGALDRAVRLTDRREGPIFYLSDGARAALRPRADGPVHLGGFKPVVACDATRREFESFLAARDAGVDRGYARLRR